MKRIMKFTLAFILAVSVSFAATTKATSNEREVDEKVIAAPVEREMIGKIRAVSVANPSKGTKSEIIVADDKSVEKIFLVNPTTTIYDAKLEIIDLNNIKVNDKVTVRYITTKEDVFEATFINILK